jgi:hypothetical protein
VDGDDGVAGIVRALEHRLQLESFDRIAQRVDLGPQLGRELGVGLGLEQFDHRPRVTEPAAQVGLGLDPGLESLDLEDDPLGLLGARPE